MESSYRTVRHWLDKRLRPEGLETIHVILIRAANEAGEENGIQPEFLLEKSPRNSLSVTFRFKSIFNESIEFEPFLRGNVQEPRGPTAHHGSRLEHAKRKCLFFGQKEDLPNRPFMYRTRFSSPYFVANKDSMLILTF